jgi:hypothetical protein
MKTMTIVRVKGIKRYYAKGRWFAYHRKTGTRLKSEFGTGEFFAELVALERKVRIAKALPGTLGMLFAAYRGSLAFKDLAASSRDGYSRMMNLLQPLDAMPLVELTPQFVAGLRDKMAEAHGRRVANYVMAVVSVACEHARNRGISRIIRSAASSACGALAARLPPIGPGPRPNGKSCSTKRQCNCVCRSRSRCSPAYAKATS